MTTMPTEVITQTVETLPSIDEVLSIQGSVKPSNNGHRTYTLWNKVVSIVPGSEKDLAIIKKASEYGISKEDLVKKINQACQKAKEETFAKIGLKI